MNIARRCQLNRVNIPRSSPSALRSPLTRHPLGSPKRWFVLVAAGAAAITSAILGEGLLVYGKEWGFLVAEPAGWHGDTERMAEKYHVNIVFVPEASASRTADVTIRVVVGKKSDENIAEDLSADMAEYRRKYPAVTFSELKVDHPRYPLVAKLFAVRGEFAEYVTYLNPGKEFPYILSVAMSKMKDEATSEELEAYRQVLRSLVFSRKAA
jgi:hypothetical protein